MCVECFYGHITHRVEEQSTLRVPFQIQNFKIQKKVETESKPLLLVYKWLKMSWKLDIAFRDIPKYYLNWLVAHPNPPYKPYSVFYPEVNSPFSGEKKA